MRCKLIRSDWCSPPAWGWSVSNDRKLIPPPVLPTRVGMVRIPNIDQRGVSGAPHPRGDGPHSAVAVKGRPPCSPPAWGWSDILFARLAVEEVLPTRVGMVRVGLDHSRQGPGAPHPRGDGPHCSACASEPTRCSPPAWGWSVEVARPGFLDGVLPTRVGMVRILGGPVGGLARAPHPRGDGPPFLALNGE